MAVHWNTYNTFSDFNQYHNLRACFPLNVMFYVYLAVFCVAVMFLYTSIQGSKLEDQCQLIWYYSAYVSSYVQHLYIVHIFTPFVHFIVWFCLSFSRTSFFCISIQPIIERFTKKSITAVCMLRWLQFFCYMYFLSTGHSRSIFILFLFCSRLIT